METTSKRVKKSFVLYQDQGEIFETLTNEQAGQLIKGVFAYSKGEEPSLDEILSVVFIPIRQTLQRDTNKWKAIVERNNMNGKKGGRPSKNKTQRNPKNPDGLSRNPKNLDNDNDNDNEIIITSFPHEDSRYDCSQIDTSDPLHMRPFLEKDYWHVRKQRDGSVYCEMVHVNEYKGEHNS